jgi:Spy/CpxP family protein refolding chaperone
VDDINARYVEVSGPLAEGIRAIRSEVLNELSSDMPDTLRLNSYSEELSQLQGRLHRQNMKHYLELKQVCTPDQVLRLSSLYRELYGCPMQGPGAERKHQHRKGE